MRSNDISFNNINICTHSHIISPENVNREHESIHKWKDLSQWLLFCEWTFFISCMLQFSFPYQWAWMNGSDLFLFLLAIKMEISCFIAMTFTCLLTTTVLNLSLFSRLSFFFVHDEQHKWLCWWKFYETFIISSFNNNLNSPSFIKCLKVSSSAFNIQKK